MGVLFVLEARNEILGLQSLRVLAVESKNNEKELRHIHCIVNFFEMTVIYIGKISTFNFTFFVSS